MDSFSYTKDKQKLISINLFLSNNMLFYSYTPNLHLVIISQSLPSLLTWEKINVMDLLIAIHGKYANFAKQWRNLWTNGEHTGHGNSTISKANLYLRKGDTLLL